MGKDSTWGFEPYLTEDQKDALNKLRDRVKEQLPPKEYLQKDSSLLRFLRARNFNLQKTWDMIVEDVEWRDPFEGYVYQRKRDFGGAYALHELGAIRLAGTSKDGRPVLSVQARQYWPKLVEDNIQIVYFFNFYVDAVCKMAEAVGQETFFGIFDLEGFALANFSFSQIKIAISILQNHYPERLGMIYVINAPWAFTAAWRMIQPLLDERTRSKVAILGSDFLNEVSQQIDLSQIETELGGTHERFPVPDPIVQIAIDNEEDQQPVSRTASSAVPVAIAVASTPPPPSPVRSGSGTLSSPAAKVKSKRSRVKSLMKKMLFISEKRMDAAQQGIDPNTVTVDMSELRAAEDEGGTSVQEFDQLQKGLLEVRVEQDLVRKEWNDFKGKMDLFLLKQPPQQHHGVLPIVTIVAVLLGLIWLWKDEATFLGST